jgi:hypothetical protein
LAARSAYELSKLPTESIQRELAEEATAGELPYAQTAAAVKQRKGKPAAQKRGFKQTFFADNGIRITATTQKKITYHDVEQAMHQALDEVRHYISQGRTVL